MAKLRHIALSVPDPEKAADFYCEAFDMERVGKTDYTEVYESTQLDEYKVSDAPYLEEFIKTVPIYEKNTNVDVILRSSHPAPATLHALSWEGDYSPRFYQRV